MLVRIFTSSAYYEILMAVMAFNAAERIGAVVTGCTWKFHIILIVYLVILCVRVWERAHKPKVFLLQHLYECVGFLECILHCMQKTKIQFFSRSSNL